jgi:hypothetical protein
VPANRIGGIVKGERGITVDTAMRLARYFATSAQMWVNLQAKYELAAAEDALSTQIEREVLPQPAAQRRTFRSIQDRLFFQCSSIEDACSWTAAALRVAVAQSTWPGGQEDRGEAVCKSNNIRMPCGRIGAVS